MLRKTLSFISVLLLVAGAAGAQNPETPAARPRTVGVVMSGGGAKGLYHIGVLEALEENGVPIDYVAGTSMGSIIAAMRPETQSLTTPDATISRISAGE